MTLLWATSVPTPSRVIHLCVVVEVAVELDSLSACVWSRLSVCLSVYQFIDDRHCDCPLYKTARVAALPCENVNVRKPAINAMSVCLWLRDDSACRGGGHRSLTAAPVPQQYSSAAAAAAPRRPRLTGWLTAASPPPTLPIAVPSTSEWLRGFL